MIFAWRAPPHDMMYRSDTVPAELDWNPKGAAVSRRLRLRRGYRDATIAGPFPGADSGVGNRGRQSLSLPL